MRPQTSNSSFFTSSVLMSPRFALSMSTLVAAVVFQEQFGLNAAISGALRSAGGVAAVIGMAVMPQSPTDEEMWDAERHICARLLATAPRRHGVSVPFGPVAKALGAAKQVRTKPYKLSFVLAFWGTLSVGMATPNVVIAATSQVFMGASEGKECGMSAEIRPGTHAKTRKCRRIGRTWHVSTSPFTLSSSTRCDVHSTYFLSVLDLRSGYGPYESRRE